MIKNKPQRMQATATSSDSAKKITQRDKYLYEWNLLALVNIYGRRILRGLK
jgi:hypothetical protein